MNRLDIALLEPQGEKKIPNGYWINIVLFKIFIFFILFKMDFEKVNKRFKKKVNALNER